LNKIGKIQNARIVMRTRNVPISQFQEISYGIPANHRISCTKSQTFSSILSFKKARTRDNQGGFAFS
jgi:hypothetical protein